MLPLFTPLVNMFDNKLLILRLSTVAHATGQLYLYDKYLYYCLETYTFLSYFLREIFYQNVLKMFYRKKVKRLNVLNACFTALKVKGFYSPGQRQFGIGGDTKGVNVSKSNLPDLEEDFRSQYLFSNSMMSNSCTAQVKNEAFVMFKRFQSIQFHQIKNLERYQILEI